MILADLLETLKSYLCIQIKPPFPYNMSNPRHIILISVCLSLSLSILFDGHCLKSREISVFVSLFFFLLFDSPPSSVLYSSLAPSPQFSPSVLNPFFQIVRAPIRDLSLILLRIVGSEWKFCKWLLSDNFLGIRSTILGLIAVCLDLFQSHLSLPCSEARWDITESSWAAYVFENFFFSRSDEGQGSADLVSIVTLNRTESFWLVSISLRCSELKSMSKGSFPPTPSELWLWM